VDLSQTRKFFNIIINESLMRNNIQYNVLTTEVSVVEITVITCKNCHKEVLVWYEIKHHAITVFLKWKQ